MITDAKIGIGIVHCQSAPGSTNKGFTTVYKSDYGKWSSIIDDTGAVFNHVKIAYETILRMIHFSKEGDGWYMCSMKPIPGRDEEYRASWVYFPSSLDLTPRDIKSVIEVAESQIKQKEFDSNKLQEVIQSYTLCKDFSPSYNVPIVQHGFAFRDTGGDYNLFDLYGCMYQKEFTQYEWVILMDKSLITFKGDGVEDISNRKIVESFIIKPIQNNFGFIPYVNGIPFVKPISIPGEERLLVVYKKDGYCDIEKSVSNQEDLTISINDCKKYFSKSQFVAYSTKDGSVISQARIYPQDALNTKDNKYWEFYEEDLEHAKFKILADGFVEVECKKDLRDLSMSSSIKFYMEPQKHEYKFVLPVDSNVVKDIESPIITICSQFEIKESPFKGYSCKGKPKENGIKNFLTFSPKHQTEQPLANNELTKGYLNSNHGGQYVGSNTGDIGNKQKQPTSKPNLWTLYIKQIALFLGVFAILGALGYAIIYICPTQGNDNHIEDATVNRSSALPDDDNNEPSDSWKLAYDYLQKNDSVIGKEEMDSFKNIEGLYDIVNEYRFSDLVSYIDNHVHKNDILLINNWESLYHKAKKIGKKGNGFYNEKSAEQTITFKKYFEKITKFESDFGGSSPNPVDKDNSTDGVNTDTSCQNKDQKNNI